MAHRIDAAGCHAGQLPRRRGIDASGTHHLQRARTQVATVVRALEHNHMKIRAVAMLAERAIDPRDFCLVLDAVSDKRDRELLQQAMSGTMGKRLLRELANGTKVLHNGQAVMPAKSLMAPY